MLIHNGSYIWFHAGQTTRWGTINAIKALPYLMIAYQIDGQWYSDPDFLPPKNLEVKPTIPISSAIIHIPKTTVELQPIVQLCAGFRNRKIHSLWVVNAPEQLLKHILECKQWNSISPKQLLETLYELILYGYEVKILPAKKETISPIEWME
ncbi:hypothetical protein FNW02_05865 [Komarekiella sp. 'clone 1']|uniref:Uncharacterized protein n=1 Tax=Komarekiella delphini-convector SJRDD-AB1 TaxID=2593771 RepID=A0AA40SU97_9NOST|nr:hypothetical protein [Komarekiella delphini-convector]MBD6615381.1 hypothetical protein [Komarekiella delphini-convector SJRDD-AB1]